MFGVGLLSELLVGCALLFIINVWGFGCDCYDLLVYVVVYLLG